MKEMKKVAVKPPHLRRHNGGDHSNIISRNRRGQITGAAAPRVNRTRATPEIGGASSRGVAAASTRRRPLNWRHLCPSSVAAPHRPRNSASPSLTPKSPTPSHQHGHRYSSAKLNFVAPRGKISGIGTCAV